MNKELLNLIKQDVLAVPWEKKPISHEFAGVYLHSNSPFKIEDHEASFHSFRVFSRYHYPLILFISPESYNSDVEKLVAKYDITVQYIRTLTSIIDFNYFSIYELPYLIPEQYEHLVYFQFDGFLIKNGWEERTCGFDWLGAKWKNPVQVIENTFNFNSVQVGNGGCNYRRRSKMLEVLDLVKTHGGQDRIVKGIKIGDKVVNMGPFLAEDLFFCYFGFGSKIFTEVPNDYIDYFALEPITWAQYNQNPKPCYFFHRIDE